MGRKALCLQFLLFWITLHTGIASVTVRLNGKNSSFEGRVEVQYRGVWGTICGGSWSIDNAHVVCSMLGFARANITKNFGPGVGQIWLGGLTCEGTETSIDRCRHSGWGNNNCQHSNDFGVVCTNSTPNIDVRMANSSLPHAAQIEIRYYGIWKPLCDNYWSLQDAHVVCRMFNYTDGAAFAVRGYQGTTSGDAWKTQISCSGTETSIDKCKIRHWGESDCSSDYRAGVVCLIKGQVSEVAIRLANGSTPNQGRVEVRYYGVWGTVCDDYWGISNAHVVCHMLNYSKALTTGTASKPWSGPILLDDVLCSGFEDSIESCRKQSVGKHNCYHGEDVVVACEYGPRAYPDINVRLVNSSFAHAGQIEMRYYGVWKPVCDGYWTKREANVACRMLGYSQGAALPVRGYQSTTGDAWGTYMICNGTEMSIDKCKHIYWEQNNCHNDHRAGVVCHTSGQDPNVAVRLVDGNAPNQGRVEVRYYGFWGTVCDDFWGLSNAHVVCRMLNYSKALWTGGVKVKGSGPILLDNVYCSGYENSLKSCWNVGWGEHNCGHYEDVGVTCANETKAQGPNIAVRLVNGSSTHEGRVEIRYYGIWGTVCDDRWGRADAHVVCRMLNYSKALLAGTAKIRGSGPIALDEVQCRGSEKSIEHCPKDKWGWHNCLHSEDAGVKCGTLSKEEKEVTARLIGTDYMHMGIVEVNYNGTWRPVCDDTWDILDAHVVCRMLGYKAALLGIKGYRVRKETGLWMGNVECSGDEKLISECYHRGWNNTWCPGEHYAGVMCNVTNKFSPVQVHLEEGSSPNSGRVAVRYGNVWGTMCIDEIDINAARVLCRMLGYPGSHYTYNFKPGSGAIWLMNLECDGTEKSIADCRHGWGNATTCSHDRDVAIMCKKADTPRFQINGTNAISESTVVILFKENPPLIGTQLKSVYQVAVEKRNVEMNFQSDGQTEPSAFIDDVNVTMETSKLNNSYIAAEILGNSSSLTIGDCQYYHGYYNAPLEPGCQYRVYVRAVTKTMERKPIYSGTAFVAFTTKRKAIPSKGTSGSTSLEAVVIVLSVIVCILILIGIGHYGWCYLRKKKASQKNSRTALSGNDPSPPHYQRLSYPATRTENNPSTPHYQTVSHSATRGITDGVQSQTNRLPDTENNPSISHYQPLSYPATRRENNPSTPHYQTVSHSATRGNTDGVQSPDTENNPSTPNYQPLSHPTTQGENNSSTPYYQPLSHSATQGENNPSVPHYQPLSHSATQGENNPSVPHYHALSHSATQGENNPSAPHYHALSHPATQGENNPSAPHYQPLSHSATQGENNPSTPHYQPLSHSATQGENNPSAPYYQPLSHSATQGENNPSVPHIQPLSHSVDQKQAGEILKKMYRKKLPDTSGASVVTEGSEPSPSNSQSLHFPSDIGGIENQGFSSSDIRLQELGFREMTDQQI